MTNEQLRQRFPRASHAFYKINSTGDPLPDSQSEPIVRDVAVAAPSGKEKGTGRFHVHVTSYRSRLCDPDNLCPKFLIDCLRRNGFIRDDRPQDIDLTISQKKCKRSEQRTEIEITPL